MDLKKHGRIFLNGLVVVTPLIITVYVLTASVLWLDRAVQVVLPVHVPGLGFVAAIVGIYAAGLLARSWLLRWPMRLAEAVVDHIPLAKSLYSAVRDMMKFLGGSDAKSRGQPCLVQLGEGQPQLLGLVTSEAAPQLASQGLPERLAVYLPMSYAMGGFTLYMASDKVRRIEGMSVEELLKLCLTAGVGARGPSDDAAPEHRDQPEHYKEEHA
jgi:uncharacterized membrane protein